MKNLTYIACLVSLAFIFSGCQKQRFLPDPHNPGLSRLTDQQTNTGTCYINEVAYINYWPKSGFSLGGGSSHFPLLQKIITPNSPDSIDYSWQIGIRKDGQFTQGKYGYITIRVPALQGATLGNLLQWSGKRFSTNECSIFIDYDYSRKGTANIYFIKVTSHEGTSGYVNMAGLFDGNVGDSILIKKGRFDFTVDARGL